MSTARLWAISGSAVALVALIIIGVLFATRSGAPGAAPTLSPTPSATPTEPARTQTPTATPSPTPTASPLVEATCEDVLTAEYLAQVAANGWQVWDTSDQVVGAQPFDDFPNGPPHLQLVCRAGQGPDVATDNVQDHAWARIFPESAIAAMQQLEADGYRRTDSAEGVYLSLPPSPGYGDADGWGETYLFTATDVRWAMTRADLSAIRPPRELL